MLFHQRINVKYNDKSAQREENNKNNKKHIEKAKIKKSQISQSKNHAGNEKVSDKANPAENERIFQKLLKRKRKRDHHQINVVSHEGPNR